MGRKVSEMTREVVMTPEGATVEVITVPPEGTSVREEIDADRAS